MQAENKFFLYNGYTLKSVLKAFCLYHCFFFSSTLLVGYNTVFFLYVHVYVIYVGFKKNSALHLKCITTKLELLSPPISFVNTDDI